MPTQAAFTIFYNQGAEKYELEQTLQPDEQMWFDIGKLIREHVPDKNGKTLPEDLTSGSYEIRDLSDIGVGTIFEGKITYDRTYGHAAYGCSTCCTYNIPVMTFNPFGIPFTGDSQDGVTAYENCSGINLDVTSVFNNNWSTANTAIATVNNTALHHGVGVGSTTSNTHGYLVCSYARGCPTCYRTPSGGDNVHPTISVTLNFTGSKSTGDNLSFLKAAAECSESLGLQNCSSTGYWLWNLEGKGIVSDDASNWTVGLSVQSHDKGYYRDANNNLQPFSCSPPSNPNDGPQADYLQQPAGQKSIFYLDGPGFYHGINPSNTCQLGTSPVDSETAVFNFQVTFTSKVIAFSETVLYYVKIVVAPGAKLDTTNSTANYGNISLSF